MSEQTSTPEKKRRRWERAFLAALAQTANVTAAARAAKIDRNIAYRLRKEDVAFAAAWEDALEQACDSLELEALRRARDGVDEPVIYQGKMCGFWVDAQGGRVIEGHPAACAFVPLTVKKYSDTLIIFLLKARRPWLYRENGDLLAKLAELEAKVNAGEHPQADGGYRGDDSGSPAPADAPPGGGEGPEQSA